MAGTNVVIFEMEIKIRVRICKIYWGKDHQDLLMNWVGKCSKGKKVKNDY